MRKSYSDFKVGPSVSKTVNRLTLCDKQRVLINRIDLGQGLDQIGHITFISRLPSPNRVGVNRDAQIPGCSCVINPNQRISKEERSGPQAQKHIVGQDRVDRAEKLAAD